MSDNKSDKIIKTNFNKDFIDWDSGKIENILEHNLIQKPENSKPDMQKDMQNSENFKQLVQDSSFAQALYAAMCNKIWKFKDSPYRWSCSWRSAGSIVADLRNQGEYYLDWYCSGITNEDENVDNNTDDHAEQKEGTVRSDIAEQLNELGWRVITQEETDSDHIKTIDKIQQLEKLKEDKTPEWFVCTLGPSRSYQQDQTCWSKRIFWLAFTGRVNETEYSHLFDCLDYTKNECG